MMRVCAENISEVEVEKRFLIVSSYKDTHTQGTNNLRILGLMEVDGNSRNSSHFFSLYYIAPPLFGIELRGYACLGVED